jgi:sec-independent protein translocase protein TatB
MFDVGFAELFLLSLIGLLVLGPERLPAVARTLGGFLRKARTSWHSLKRSIETELSAAENANPLRDVQEEMDSLKRQVSDLSREIEDTVQSPMKVEEKPAASPAPHSQEDTADAKDEVIVNPGDDGPRQA